MIPAFIQRAHAAPAIALTAGRWAGVGGAQRARWDSHDGHCPAGVDAFLTVDDRLLNRAKRYTRELGVRVINPVSFIREVERDIDG